MPLLRSSLLGFAGVLVSALPAGASLLRAAASHTEEASEGLQSIVEAGPPDQLQSIHYVMRTLNELKQAAGSAEHQVQQRSGEIQPHLQAVAKGAAEQEVQLALSETAARTEGRHKEAAHAYDKLGAFADSVMNLLRHSASQGKGCDSLSCGENSFCTVTMKGALCMCNEGYITSGQGCQPPTEFRPHHLLNDLHSQFATRAADMHVSVFETNKVAVVFRDLTKGNKGKLILGTAREGGLLDLSTPELFTVKAGKAFDPVVAGTDDQRLLVAWRDDDRMGNCWVRGGAVGSTGVRGADLAITWGEPVNFCYNQAHKMSALPLKDNQLMVLFSDKAPKVVGQGQESFGNSLLAHVGPTGGLELLGKFRFTDHVVTRLEATKISPTAFVLVARASKAVDDLDPHKVVHQEALALWGELVNNGLVFSQSPVALEPERPHMWARGVSLIAPNTVAYAYQDGGRREVKMAVLKVDPSTKRLEVVRGPEPLLYGTSPYVSMLSVPYSSSKPHTLVYYEGQTDSMVNLCSWNPAEQKLEKCEDFPWLTEKVSSVSGVHLGGGRSLMVFASKEGVPFYTIFGLSKK